MFFVETDDVGALDQRLQARGSRFAAHTRDEAGLAELFIHPSAFLGVLIGVSRTEHAWTWSGDPNRARRHIRELAGILSPAPRTLTIEEMDEAVRSQFKKP